MGWAVVWREQRQEVRGCGYALTIMVHQQCAVRNCFA